MPSSAKVFCSVSVPPLCSWCHAPSEGLFCILVFLVCLFFCSLSLCRPYVPCLVTFVSVLHVSSVLSCFHVSVSSPRLYECLICPSCVPTHSPSSCCPAFVFKPCVYLWFVCLSSRVSFVFLLLLVPLCFKVFFSLFLVRCLWLAFPV